MVLGLVLAVMDGTALMEMWRSFIGLFFMLSAIILLIAFVTSSVTSMQQHQAHHRDGAGHPGLRRRQL